MMQEQTVTLDSPIIRGDQKIKSLTIRKPSATSLQGVSLVSLVQCDVDSLIKVLPRITEPTLTEHDVRNMDPADLMACGLEIAMFFVKKQDIPEELAA